MKSSISSALALAGIAIFSAQQCAEANPIGGVVAAGTATISQSGTVLTIDQLSSRAIINWTSFNIGSGQSTSFHFLGSAGSASAVLNEVSPNAGASVINGLLNSFVGAGNHTGGTVYVYNPNGLLIGPSGSINVGSFVGTTLSLNDGTFMKGGNLTLGSSSAASTGTIQNQGQVTGLDDVFLIAHSVENDGTVTGENVGMAAASYVEIKQPGQPGSDRISVLASAPTSSSGTGVDNSATGVISAVTTELQASGGNAYALAVNNSGVIHADTLVSQGGHIYLTGNGGAVQNSGTLDASDAAVGGKGGSVDVTGGEVTLTGTSKIDVNGSAGGGSVDVGGGISGAPIATSTTVDSGSTITANATLKGNGGDVQVWSSQNTDYQGAITATGGLHGGNGGSTAVNSLGDGFEFGGTVNLLAPKGKVGMLKLDPEDLTVEPGSDTSVTGTGGFSDGGDGVNATIDDGEISALLTTASVTLYANDTITLLNNVNINSTSASSLVFRAGNSILFQGNATVSLGTGGSFSATFNDGGANPADRIAGAATFTMSPGSSITAPGGITIESGNFAGGVGAMTLSGLSGSTLTLSTADTISQVSGGGAINLTGTATVGSTGSGASGDITLDNAANVFPAGVSITSANDVNLSDSVALAVNGTVTGNLTATGAGIGDGGTALTVGGTTTLTAGTGNDITLGTTGDAFTGGVSVVSGDNVTLNDSSALAVNGTVTGDLIATGAGISDGGSVLTVGGTTTLTAGANPISLTTAGDTFTGSVDIVSANNVEINATGGLTIADPVNVGTGDIDLSATGNIAIDANLTGGAVVLDSTGTAVDSVSFGTGVTVQADSQTYEAGLGNGSANTATVDLVDNTPMFLNSAGTGAPATFVIAQDASITGSTDLPSISQFGGSLSGTAYTIQSYGGNVVLDPGSGVNVAGSALSLTAVSGLNFGTVSILDPLTLASLTANGERIDLGADVTTSAGQTYNGAVALQNNILLTDTGTASIAFNSTVDGAYTLDVETVGGTFFDGAVGSTTPLTSLTVGLGTGGITFIDGDAVTTAGGQTYGGPVFLEGNSTTLSDIAGGNITFGSFIQGFGSLDVETAGTTTFDGRVGLPFPLQNLTVDSTDPTGTIDLNCGLVLTEGGQTYGGAVVLGANTELINDGVGNITFGSTLDGAYTLDVETFGLTTFSGAVGGITPLNSLTVDGDYTSGTIALNGGTVTTAGGQTYGGAVTLGANTELSDIASGNITFNSTVDGYYTLDVETAGLTTFGGALGSITALSTLTVDGTDTTGSIALNGGYISTIGSQNYGAPVTLGQNTLLTDIAAGSSIAFNSTVDGDAMLFVNSPGTVVFGGAVGSITPLAALDVDEFYPGAEIELNGGSVTTAGGGQTYNGSVMLGQNTVLSDTADGALTFNSTLDGGYTLDVETAGTTVFNGAVGSITPLASLTVDQTDTGAILEVNGGSITTTGDQSYGAPLMLGADTTLTCSTLELNEGAQGPFNILTLDNSGQATAGAILGVEGLVLEGSGNVGSLGSPISMDTLYVDFENAGGSSWLDNNGNDIAIYGSTGGGSINLSAGATVLPGSLDAGTGTVTLDTTSLLLNGSLFASAVTLDNSGLVSGPAPIVAGTLTLEGSGDVGSSGTPFGTQVGNVVFDDPSGSTWLNNGLMAVNLSGTTDGGDINVTAGATTISGSLIAHGSDITLNTTTLDLGGELIGAAITLDNSGLVSGAGPIYGGTLTLEGAGDVGTGGVPITTGVGNIVFDNDGGNSWIENVGHNVNISGTTGGGSIDLEANGVTVNGVLNAGTGDIELVTTGLTVNDPVSGGLLEFTSLGNIVINADLTGTAIDVGSEGTAADEITFGPGVTVRADSQFYAAGIDDGSENVASADLVDNSPVFMNTAGTSAPFNFTYAQDASILGTSGAGNNIPLITQFGGPLNNTVYTLWSGGGDITINPGSGVNLAGSQLTLRAPSVANTGTVTIDDPLNLSWLMVEADPIDINADVTTTTALGQTYSGSLTTLTADVELTSLGGGGIVFNSPVDGGGYDLTLNNSGPSAFNGTVTDVNNLEANNLGSTLTINTTTVSTLGDQDYLEPVILAPSVGTVTLTSGTIELEGVTGNGNNLTLANTATATLNGPFTGVGTVDATGGAGANLVVNSSIVAANLEDTETTYLNGGIVTTADGDQDYSATVTLGAGTTLNSGTIELEGVIGNGNSLTLNNTAAATLSGPVAGVSAFTVSGSGTGVLTVENSAGITAASVTDNEQTTLDGVSITATSDQDYTGAVILGAGSTTLASGTIELAGVTGSGNLVLNNSGAASLNGVYDTTGALIAAGSGTLAVDSSINARYVGDSEAKTTLSGGTVTTTGAQIYNGGTVVLGADTTLSGTFMMLTAVNLGGDSLTLDNSSLAILSGAVTGTGALTAGGTGNLRVDNDITAGSFSDSEATTTLNGTAGSETITTTAGQSYTGSTLVLGANTTLTGTTLSLPTVTMGGDSLTLNNSGLATLNGPVTGTGALAATGGGTLAVDSTINVGSVNDAEVTSLDGGTVTTVGGQIYDAGVTLDTATVLSSTDGGDISFGTRGTISGSEPLDVETTGTTTLGAPVSVMSLIVDGTDTTGTIDLNGGSVTTSAGQTYDGAVTLTADTLLADTDGSAITFGPVATIGGAYSLEVETTGATTFGAAVNIASLVADQLDTAGTIDLNGGTVTTSAGQTYDGAVTLGASTSLTDTGSGAIAFGPTATINGAYPLQVETAGATIFGAPVAVTSLTVDNTDTAGTIDLDAGTVTTTAGQTYDGAVTLSAPTVLTDTGSSAITFGATAVVSGAETLEVETAGTTTFGAPVSVESLTVDRTDTTGTIDLNGGTVTTVGGQDYAGTTVDLGANTTLTGTTISLPVVAMGDNSLTLANSGLATLNGTVTGTGALAASGGGTLIVDGAIAAGSVSDGETTTLSGGTVTTTAGQDYTGDVTLTVNTILTGTTLSLDGVSMGSENLTLDNSGLATLNGAVLGTGALTASGAGNLTVNNNIVVGTVSDSEAVTTLNGSAGTEAITTTGAQSYTGTTVDLGGNTILTGTTLVLPAVTMGSENLTLDNSGLATLNGAVTGTGILTASGAGNLTVNNDITAGSIHDSEAVTTLNGTDGFETITTTGGQSYTGTSVILDANTTLAATTLELTAVNMNDEYLNLLNSGTATLNGPVSGTGELEAAGGGTLIVDNEINVGGVFDGEPTTLNGTGGSETVTTTGYQDYNGALTLGAPTKLSSTEGGEITFNSTVNGFEPLDVETGGETTFNGPVGSVTALASLTVDGTTEGGTIDLDGGTITTTGLQYFGGAVTLGEDALVTSTQGGNITFASAVDATAPDDEGIARPQVDGAQSLDVETAGTTTFEGAVGGTTALANLTIDQNYNMGVIDLFGGIVTTSGSQLYDTMNTVVLGADTTLTSGTTLTLGKLAPAGTLPFTVDGDNDSLTLINGGPAIINGTIGTLAHPDTYVSTFTASTTGPIEQGNLTLEGNIATSSGALFPSTGLPYPATASTGGFSIVLNEDTTIANPTIMRFNSLLLTAEFYGPGSLNMENAGLVWMVPGSLESSLNSLSFANSQYAYLPGLPQVSVGQLVDELLEAVGADVKSVFDLSRKTIVTAEPIQITVGGTGRRIVGEYLLRSSEVYKGMTTSTSRLNFRSELLHGGKKHRTAMMSPAL